MAELPALVVAALALQAPCLGVACDTGADVAGPEPALEASAGRLPAEGTALPVPVELGSGPAGPGDLLDTHLPDPREPALEAPSTPSPDADEDDPAPAPDPASPSLGTPAVHEPTTEPAPRAEGEATQAPHAPRALASSAAGAAVDEASPVRTLAGLALGAVVLVLYHRLSKERLLDHDTRQRILGLLEDEPGLATSELAERLDVSYRTARHHANKLARFGLVVRLEDAGPERWSRPDDAPEVPQPLPGELRELLAAVRDAEASHLSALARRLDLAKATAKHRLDWLLEREWIDDERVGPLRRFHVTEAGRDRLDVEG